MKKLTEITPEPFLCAVGPCPAVFDTGEETLVIVGKKLSAEDRSLLPPGKVAPDEDVIAVPAGMIMELLGKGAG